MAASKKGFDPTFQGAGQRAGIEIWRIEGSKPVPIPESSHGKFLTGDSYVVLKTMASKNGVLSHVIHYWLGKDATQDEADSAAFKTVELDAALNRHSVQYREVQGHETDMFLSYFKPCIMPEEGKKHAKAEERNTRLLLCKGKHVARIKEVPFARSTLNHDNIFILDTKSKIFQFNGSNSSSQERAKALEVMQYIRDIYHGGKCDLATVEDGKLMANADAGEFWALFGGFAPLQKKPAIYADKTVDSFATKLYCTEKGRAEHVEADSLTRDLLDSSNCYILDCGLEVFVWMGKNTQLAQRKSASVVAEELVRDADRPNCLIVRVSEGFETVLFRSKFHSWPQTIEIAAPEEVTGKVAALLKRQGLNVKGLLKDDSLKEEPDSYIDCTGNLQVWRVNGQEKVLLTQTNQSKFYSGDCYLFQYSYPGADKEEHLIGTWFGKQSSEEDRASAISMATKMIESMKFLPAQAHINEGKEPLQFFSILQSFVIFKGGISDGYKKYIAENGIPDETYKENSVALFRVQGSGPDNMQAIQLDAVAPSLNSSYCYVIHNESVLFIWYGNYTTSDEQELVERMLDLIKPDGQPRIQKEGLECEEFWKILGEKCEYPNQKPSKDVESDTHLFSCSFSNGDLKVSEIYNFTQDDLMTEDIFILDCRLVIYVWVGNEVDAKSKLNALTIGKKFLEHDFLMENISREAPIYVVKEGNEPTFFTRFFKWDSAKPAIHGNSFQRKLAIMRNGGTPPLNKPRRRTTISRSGLPEQTRSRSVSFSPDRLRVRGRSPAFNALAANFENPNARNLSTPPPVIRKLDSRSVTPELSNLAPKAPSIAALSSSFERSPRLRDPNIPRSPRTRLLKSKPERSSLELSTEENEKKEKPEDKERLSTFPYERLMITSTDPVSDIDVTRRESYLSSEEFKEKFGMEKNAFYKLPKWKQAKLKMAVLLF